MGLKDISYPVNEGMAIYPNNPAFLREVVSDVEKGDNATVSRLEMGSHTGTHIDAPAHFIPGGKTLDKIPLDRMNGRAKVVDVTGNDDIGAELIRGISIEEDDIILFRTDNSVNWNCDRILDEYVTLTYEAAEYLAGCQVKLVGIDYLTVERPRGKRESGRSVHNILLGNGILICEGLNLKDIREGSYEFFCLPLKIEGADGCPVRCALRNAVDK